VGRATRSDQDRDNRAVADEVELTRSDGRFVCRARVANSFVARFRGLMLTASLEPGTGLLFPRTRSVHTHFMRYPIDVVFLDADGRVASIRHGLRPWRFASSRGSRSVLELPSGESARLGLAEGDVVS
jgi:uncharacterized membrane protein (UPF0127 family)